jgi:hypothetical protein
VDSREEEKAFAPAENQIRIPWASNLVGMPLEALSPDSSFSIPIGLQSGCPLNRCLVPSTGRRVLSSL